MNNDDGFCETCQQNLLEMSLEKRKDCRKNHKVVRELRILTSIDSRFRFVIKVPFNTQKEKEAISKALKPLGFKLVHKTW